MKLSTLDFWVASVFRVEEYHAAASTAMDEKEKSFLHGRDKIGIREDEETGEKGCLSRKDRLIQRSNEGL